MPFSVIKTVKWNIFRTIRAFDIMQKLRARPKYQLSSSTKCPDISLLYLVWLRFFCLYQILLVMCSRGEPLLTTLKVVISLTTLLIFYQYILWKHCFSIASLFTFKSCYKIMVLTHACLCIGWNTRAISCISGPIRGLKVNFIEAGQHTLKTQSDNIAITGLTWLAESVKIVSLKKCCLLKVFSACWWLKV